MPIGSPLLEFVWTHNGHFILFLHPIIRVPQILKLKLISLSVFYENQYRSIGTNLDSAYFDTNNGFRSAVHSCVAVHVDMQHNNKQQPKQKKHEQNDRE